MRKYHDHIEQKSAKKIFVSYWTLLEIHDFAWFIDGLEKEVEDHVYWEDDLEYNNNYEVSSIQDLSVRQVGIVKSLSELCNYFNSVKELVPTTLRRYRILVSSTLLLICF